MKGFKKIYFLLSISATLSGCMGDSFLVPLVPEESGIEMGNPNDSDHGSGIEMGNPNINEQSPGIEIGNPTSGGSDGSVKEPPPDIDWPVFEDKQDEPVEEFSKFIDAQGSPVINDVPFEQTIEINWTEVTPDWYPREFLAPAGFPSNNRPDFDAPIIK